jgi:hypothetical protein
MVLGGAAGGERIYGGGSSMRTSTMASTSMP